jgi:pimeloyl-ACP methyl ester carboxylesterase
MLNKSLLAIAATVAVWLSAAHPTLSQPATPTSKAKSFAVRVTGTGKPMILIPGLTCSGDVWDSTVEHFKGRYQCHVLTLAGFAGQPPISPPLMETVRKDLAGYIRAKKLEHPVLSAIALADFCPIGWPRKSQGWSVPW